MTSAPWRDISGVQRQDHQKDSRHRLPVRSRSQKIPRFYSKYDHFLVRDIITCIGKNIEIYIVAKLV